MLKKIKFKERSIKKELLDDYDLDRNTINKNLKEFIILNKYFGTKNTLISALDKIYYKYKQRFNHCIRIADLGCGAGDILKDIHEWAIRKNIFTKLYGFDNHPIILNFAKEYTKNYSNIEIQFSDILSNISQEQKFDIICLTNVCHHFTDEQLVNLIKTLSSRTQLSVIINDLRRNWLAYLAIKFITKVFKFSYAAQNDGPLSVLKSFHSSDLKKYLSLAKIDNYELNKVALFRWQLIIWLGT